jgi:protocatechuate 3,4-dioxygenase beta subunit
MRLILLSCAVITVVFGWPAYSQGPAGGAQIVGRVIDADSKAPIAGVRVTLLPNARPAPMTLLTPPMAMTDENGRFSFDGIAAGQLRITAQKQGFAFEPTDAPVIEARAGQAITVDLSLRRGGALTGRILDERGEPLSEIRVSAMRRLPGRGDRRMAMGGPGSVTNDLGEFRLAGLSAGEYVVMATGPLHSPFTGGAAASSTTWAPTYYPGTINQAEAHLVSLAQADTVTGLEFRLIAAPAFRVSGIAIDESGKPVPDAMITIVPASARSQGGFAPPLMGRSNTDGTFAIGGVMAGKYVLMASRMIRSASGTSSVISMGRIGTDPGTEVQIEVDAANVTGLKVIVPPPQ